MKPSKNDFTDIEKEILVLSSSIELIYDMICPGNTTISKAYASPINWHANRLFFIHLVDFLSQTDIDINKDKDICKNTSLPNMLTYLSKNSILFDHNQSLQSYTNDFSDWLEHEVSEKVYLAEISKEIKFNISRKEMILFSGNINKHNLLRFLRNIKMLHKVNPSISQRELLDSMDSLKLWIEGTFLAYHFATLVEFLVHIFNEILISLSPIFDKHYVQDDAVKYHYTRPGLIKEDKEFNLFWNLMNLKRNHPIIVAPNIPDLLKQRY